jgi:hypothetical protein
MKLINFIGKFFTDKSGNPSSKRLTGFTALGLVVVFALKSLSGVDINMEMFYILVSLIGYTGTLSVIEKK